MTPLILGKMRRKNTCLCGSFVLPHQRNLIQFGAISNDDGSESDYKAYYHHLFIYSLEGMVLKVDVCVLTPSS